MDDDGQRNSDEPTRTLSANSEIAALDGVTDSVEAHRAKARLGGGQDRIAAQHARGKLTAVNAGYYRTWFGNFWTTDNLAVTPDDFDPYCITAPVDSRLGSVSGSEVCGL